MRAYNFAMTPPTLPVLIVAAVELQEDPIPENLKLRIPTLPKVAYPQGDPGPSPKRARLLVDAENPVLIADRYARSPDGAKRLVELAEALQCPIDCPRRSKLGPEMEAEFPSWARKHPRS